MRVFSSKDFAEAVGISERVARRAFARGHYRGQDLPVLQMPGGIGGAGGKVWALSLDHCSPELRAKLEPAALSPVETPVKKGVIASISDAQIAGQLARFRIIQPILATPKGSPERAEATREVAAQRHDYPGGVQTFAESTLRKWIVAFERDGFTGLLPKIRSDKGQQRVLVTREWDAGIDLPEDRKRAVAAELAREARSAVANDGAADREVLRVCRSRLARKCLAAGSALPGRRLLKLCALNVKWAKRERIGRFRLVHMHDKDHAAYQNKAEPRIERELSLVPMDLLVGDVHYADMFAVDENGDIIRIRLIAWLDTSSMYVWVTPVILPKGKGVRQEDVVESYSHVVFDPDGGLPREVYIDNGSEFAWLPGVMARLALLSEMGFGSTKAKPYAAQSKGEIEGFFKNLEGVFKGLDGWIGGDRANKKTENKGKVVKPYSHGIAQLIADIHAAVMVYNNRPQSGRLGELSPREMLDRKQAATDFTALIPTEDAFARFVSRVDTRTVRQGMITVEDDHYYSPRAVGLVDERVEVHIPLRACGRVWLRHDGKDLGWAELERPFAHGDRAGARRQAEMSKDLRDEVKSLRSEVCPSIRIFDLQKEDAEAAVAERAANKPDPQRLLIPSLAIDKTLLPPDPAERDAAENAERQALIDDFLALSGKGERPAAATAGLSGAT